MQRRRKKRCPNNNNNSGRRGTRNNFEVERELGGFGFTISGQQPCILSCIVRNSPADLAGLCAGDFLISVNGQAVSKLPHDQIVQLISRAEGPKIWLTTSADNYYKSESDSSEQDSPSLVASHHHHAGGVGSTSSASQRRMRPKYNANKVKAFRSTPSGGVGSVGSVAVHRPPQQPPFDQIGLAKRSLFNQLDNHPHAESAGCFCVHDNPDLRRPARDSASILIEPQDCVQPLEYKIIVGYLGTIEMPGALSGPKLPIVRQCIKKMRQEKRQPVAVLMTILPNQMTLTNANKQVLATYAANRMSFVSNGRESETEGSHTNFGLITTAYYNASGMMMVNGGGGVAGGGNQGAMTAEAIVSNSCHVFMVNQKIVDHRVHFEKLSLFKIRCTRDPISNLCLEFPRDTDYVVNLIRSMYGLNMHEERMIAPRLGNGSPRRRGLVDDRNEMAALSNSPQPSNHSELTTSSNSDSGIGFHNDCSNISDRILVVDFPGLRPRPNNIGDWFNMNAGYAGGGVGGGGGRPAGISTDRDLCQIEGGANKEELVELPPPPVVVVPSVQPFQRILHKKSKSVDFSFDGVENSAAAAERPAETESKLTVRAMPFPRKSSSTSSSPATKLNRPPPPGGPNQPPQGYEERAIDVPEEVVLEGNRDGEPEKANAFKFRAPVAPSPAAAKSKSAKQRMNFLTYKLSPKVFGVNRPMAQSCENISTAAGSKTPSGRRKLVLADEDAGEQCERRAEDEYIDIWGSTTEVDERACKRLYSEIELEAQRKSFLEGATSEPALNVAAKSLAEDLIGGGHRGDAGGGGLDKGSRHSPFRRYGQLSSSFRSQLTATEAKKMLTNGLSAASATTTQTSNHAGPYSKQNDIYLPTRPRSLASSEGDVFSKATRIQGHSELTATNGHGNHNNNCSSAKEGESKTRVLDWSTSFEKLLGDPYAIHAFAEFLKKEFSAENILFWAACERYRQLEGAGERQAEAQLIFERHLECGAPEPVNIDSQATSNTKEQLKMAERDLFAAAQKQIFNLMKFDSYARFIKSDIYKSCLDCEMKKLPPPYPEGRAFEAALRTSPVQMQQAATTVTPISPVKLKKSLSNAEDRRRKSLLPWHRKTRSKSKDRPQAHEDAHRGVDIHSSRSSLSSFDAVLSKSYDSSDSSAEYHRSQLCRVILANGATTIVQTRATESVRELVDRLLEKRGLDYTCYEVFVSGSSKPCDQEAMSTQVAGKQVHIEQRVTFKLDLPNRKVISVKSKPAKLLEEVLRPILFKYHYSLDEVLVLEGGHVNSGGGGGSLSSKLVVTAVDGKRLQIVDRQSRRLADQGKSTLSEITNRVFNELLPEHIDGQNGIASVKKLADYMNCRLAGHQLVEVPAITRSANPEGKAYEPQQHHHEDHNKEDSNRKMPVIAKWTTGVNLQSPSYSDGGAMKQAKPPHPITFDLPEYLKGEAAKERPTPAPRLSITRNSLQTSLSSSASMNNSQDSGILSNKSVLSAGASSQNDSSLPAALADDQSDSEHQLSGGSGYAKQAMEDDDHLRAPPPPLPPKPKKLPIKPSNWGHSSSAKNIYLDQPTSSFV